MCCAVADLSLRLYVGLTLLFVVQLFFRTSPLLLVQLQVILLLLPTARHGEREAEVILAHLPLGLGLLKAVVNNKKKKKGCVKT
jgi:hypothetical protein